MNKNILNLYDYVKCTLVCSYCGDEFGGYGDDVLDVAEAADEWGWKITKSGYVKCPKCTPKITTRKKS